MAGAPPQLLPIVSLDDLRQVLGLARVRLDRWNDRMVASLFEELDTLSATLFSDAPPGQPPINDARLLGWETCRGTTCRSITCADAARGRDTRVTFTAQRAVDPRVFAPGGRYAGMVAGLTAEERERRISAIAAGINHWAIPSDEKLHLLIEGTNQQQVQLALREIHQQLEEITMEIGAQMSGARFGKYNVL